MVVKNYLLWIFYLTITTKVTTALSTIATIPSTTNNTFATGYSPLIVKAQFEQKGDITFCALNYEGKLNGQPWYSSSFGCVTEGINEYGANETISCNESIINEIDYVISNITFTQPLTSDINVTFYCGFATLRLDLFVTVQECATSLAHSVIVKSNKRIYKAKGQFDCVNNGKLFYSNKTELSTTETICLVSTKWSGQNDLECWIAPDVTLNGNLSVIEGFSLDVSCNYIDVTPVGDYSIFYFGKTTAVMSKNERFMSQKLQPEDNNKVISCQAVTPYTQVYNSSGRSADYTINVWFQPYQDSHITCNWYINETGTCNVLFSANPKPQFISLTKCDSSKVKNDVENIISTINDDYFQVTFHKKNVLLTEKGFYKLSLRSSIFPDDSTISFTINVEKNDPTSTAMANICERSSNFNNLLIAVSCIAGLLLATVIGLIIRLHKMSKLLSSKHIKASEQDDSGYIEFQQRNKMELQLKNKNNKSRSYVDMKATSLENTQQATSSTAYLNQNILPTNEADYVEINPSSNEKRNSGCDSSDVTSNANENVDTPKSKSTYENLNSISTTDRNYEIIS